MKLWHCPREWPGSNVYIVGGGPSLKGTDLAPLKGRKVIVINSSFNAAPFADFLFFGDSRWWNHYEPTASGFAGRIVTSSPSIHKPGLLYMRKVTPPPGISPDRDALALRYTSTQGAMNLAVHLGAARIILLGADACNGAAHRSHHHKIHPWPQQANGFELQLESLSHAVEPLKAMGIEVLNTSPITAIPWWEKRSLEECLAQFA